MQNQSRSAEHNIGVKTMKGLNSNTSEEQECRKHQKTEPGPSSPVDPASFARNYQLEALEMATKQNTIAFLETGSGKTLIAIMLLKSYAYLLRKPSESIAVFLVPTVVLVSQQARGIEMYTDLKVGKFWGDLGVDLWDAKIWKKQLDNYEVFVMTPQILLDNLRHSFFKLNMIKLLIFDECHNARGKSSYACIMKEFYHRQLLSKSISLPRIFGMTASLMKSKASGSSLSYGKEIQDLESLMNAKVYTVTDNSELAKYIPFSAVKLKLYRHIEIPYHLYFTLADHLKTVKQKHTRGLQVYGQNEQASLKKRISKLHDTYGFCLEELGAWMALQAAVSLSSEKTDIFFWGEYKDKLSENAVRSFSREVSEIFLQYMPSGQISHIGDDLKTDVDTGFLSAKVDCLISSLLGYRHLKDLRCIIFVERVITAIVLQVLLSRLEMLSCWKTTYVAGNHSGLQAQTRSEQMKIVNAFREGKVNIIVATQILEEGLDVKACNLVIRFDPSVTVCSFIQSRGRARMQGSDYLLIIRSDDDSTISRMEKYLCSGDIMREESLRLASVPCATLDKVMLEAYIYSVEKTGAWVSLNSSVALIYRYCSQLPADSYFTPCPKFDIDKDVGICTLSLPKSCSVPPIEVHGPIDILKQIACLEACKKLHEIGALTDYLLPESTVETEDASESGASGTGDKVYDESQVHYFPGELADRWLSYCGKQLYYCYSISFERNFNYDVPFRNMKLITKCDLDSDFLNVGFALETNKGSLNIKVEYTGTIQLSVEQVLMGQKFQVTLLRLLIDQHLNKLKGVLDQLHREETSGPNVAYLLLPSVVGCSDYPVDWDCVRSGSFYPKPGSSCDIVGKHRFDCCAPLEYVTDRGVECACMLRESLVYTPHNGHIYCVTGILDDLNGNSDMKLRGKGMPSTYKEYFKLQYGITLKYEKQPLLRGRHLFTVQNWLHKRPVQKEKEQHNAMVELPPELCMIIMSPVPISVVYSFSFLPSVMRRIEAMLLAYRLKKTIHHDFQNLNVPTVKVLEALTTKKCQEEFSFESLEALGDSFLKYAASQQLFRTHLRYHEGLLSSKKDRMVSNDSLCKLACNRNLPGYIQDEFFNPELWIVPAECSTYLGEHEISCPKEVYIRGKRCLKYKRVADSVEALIGAFLCSNGAHGEVAALCFMNWLGMGIDFVSDVQLERPLLQHPEKFINISQIETLLNYSFRDPSLLVEALTHGSYQTPVIPRCYQRLEFLGDSILDYLITKYFYETYPGISPGLLTDLRSASVNNDCYAHAAVKAGLNKHLLHASSVLHQQMTFFIENCEQLFSGSSFGWESGIELPKVLGDIIESLGGAILVDSGFNKEAVWNSIRPLLEPLVTLETIKFHPVRELRELCSKKAYDQRLIKLCSDGRASIKVEVFAQGKLYSETRTGANKKMAEKLAAQAVLKSLKADIPGL